MPGLDSAGQPQIAGSNREPFPMKNLALAFVLALAAIGGAVAVSVFTGIPPVAGCLGC
jgi:hypothetical protein